MTRYLIRFLVVGYVLALILGPLYMVFEQALDQGLDTLWEAITTDAFVATDSDDGSQLRAEAGGRPLGSQRGGDLNSAIPPPN